jgi:hypothetical protein
LCQKAYQEEKLHLIKDEEEYKAKLTRISKEKSEEDKKKQDVKINRINENSKRCFVVE